MTHEQKLPRAILWGLGLTQTIAYGTIFYSFSILVPAIAHDLHWSEQWVFGGLSLSLFASGAVAPAAGHWADRFGAGRVLTLGSLAAALALAACALAPNGPTFVLALFAMQCASAFIFYNTAFVAVVQLGGRRAQRSIVHLTLIAGFASTLFWPLTTTLHQHLSWREVYLLFAALNLVVCLPIHAYLATLPWRDVSPTTLAGPGPIIQSDCIPFSPRDRSIVLALMLAGFAVEGFILSSILIHMVPLTAALGMGSAGLLVAGLFGPAQVASRFTNMLFGGNLAQTWLAVIGAVFLPLGLVVLLVTTPLIPGAVIFAILFGLGSGLASIVGGTLPLELFGRRGYGASVGWVTAARQISSAIAPFALAVAMKAFGVSLSLSTTAAIGVLGVGAFLGIVMMSRRYARQSEIHMPAEVRLKSHI